MKKAIILFNLGGPDKIENVEPFLFNLFNDPAILNIPTILRYPLAKLISNRRAPVAKKIYEELGGSSPILKLTKEQSEALEIKLNQTETDNEYKCFIVMRCWNPRANDVINIDYDVDPVSICREIKIPVQGGLDPKILLTDKENLKKETLKYLNTFKDHPYIFNLGHGVLPETNPDMVDYLVKTVKDY